MFKKAKKEFSGKMRSKNRLIKKKEDEAAAAAAAVFASASPPASSIATSRSPTTTKSSKKKKKSPVAKTTLAKAKKTPKAVNGRNSGLDSIPLSPMSPTVFSDDEDEIPDLEGKGKVKAKGKGKGKTSMKRALDNRDAGEGPSRKMAREEENENENPFKDTQMDSEDFLNDMQANEAEQAMTVEEQEIHIENGGATSNEGSFLVSYTLLPHIV